MTLKLLDFCRLMTEKLLVGMAEVLFVCRLSVCYIRELWPNGAR